MMYDSERELDGSGSEASIDHDRQNTERLVLVNHKKTAKFRRQVLLRK